LGNRAGEIDAGHRDALPKRSLGGEAPLIEGGHPQVWEISQRGGKSRGRDDLVHIEHEVARLSSSFREYPVSLSGAFDPFNGGVEHEGPAAQNMILVRLQIASPRGGGGVSDDRYSSRPGGA